MHQFKAIGKFIKFFLDQRSGHFFLKEYSGDESDLQRSAIQADAPLQQSKMNNENFEMLHERKTDLTFCKF